MHFNAEVYGHELPLQPRLGNRVGHGTEDFGGMPKNRSKAIEIILSEGVIGHS
tara:strand:+ start:1226 stop:1384 length:159 start_codon:yes stop_codon:yes gene_type:complete